MPFQKLILRCSEGNEIYHPTHGVVRHLEVYYENNGETDRILATYIDNENCHIKLSSDKLSENLDECSFTTLIYGIMLIPDHKNLAMSLLSLLNKDSSIPEDLSCIKTNSDINLTDQVLREQKLSSTESHGTEKYGQVPKFTKNILHDNQDQEDISDNGTEWSQIMIKNEKEDNPQDTAIDNENSKDHENTNAEAAFDNIIEKKNISSLVLFDGTKIQFPVEPRDMFHIATPDILDHFNKHEKQKLILQQAYIEWKYCLKSNADGFMLIHLAVLNNDIDLVRRQIEILRAKKGSVDVMANGMSPLHIAITNSNIKCTELLLAKGANPLLRGVDCRNSLHLAALATPDILDLVINAFLEVYEKQYDCEQQANTNDTQKDEIFTITDAFGYNAFMLACKNGNLKNALKIHHQCPRILDVKMPSTGNTALNNEMSSFLALYNTKKRSELPKAPLNIVLKLLHLCASPYIENHYGQTFFNILNKCDDEELKLYIHKIARSRPFANFDYFWDVFIPTKNDVADVTKTCQSSEVKDCENQCFNGKVVEKSLKCNNEYESEGLNEMLVQKRFVMSEKRKAATVNCRYLNGKIKHPSVVQVENNPNKVFCANDDSVKVDSKKKTVSNASLTKTVSKTGLTKNINVPKDRTVSKTYPNGYPLRRKHLNVSKTYPIKRIKSNDDALEKPVSIVDDAKKPVSIVNDANKSVSIVDDATKSFSKVDDTKRAVSTVDDTKKAVSKNDNGNTKKAVSKVGDTNNGVEKVDDTKKSVSIDDDAKKAVLKVDNTKKGVEKVDDTKNGMGKLDDTKKSVSIDDDAKKSVSIDDDAKKSVSKVDDTKKFVSKIADIKNVLNYDLKNNSILTDDEIMVHMSAESDTFRIDMRRKSILKLNSVQSKPVKKSQPNIAAKIESMKRRMSTFDMLNIPNIKLVKKTDLKNMKNVFVLKQGFA